MYLKNFLLPDTETARQKALAVCTIVIKNSYKGNGLLKSAFYSGEYGLFHLKKEFYRRRKFTVFI